MGLIGKIWVKLGLDNSEFKQGMQGAQKEASGFQNFIKGVGQSMLAAFSIGAVVNFGKAAVKAYNEQAVAMAKMEAVIKSTGSSAGLTAKQLGRYATELQQITTFGDEASMEAMARLLTFKSIQGQTFKDTIKSAQDLATVMGTDLNSAVMQLGKALEQPEIGLTMLRRSGISFSNEQIEQIKRLVDEGKKHEAQLIILAEVQTQFGGAAKAAANTAEGAWKQVGNALGDLMEQIGSAVEPTKGFAKVFSSLLVNVGNVFGSQKLSFFDKVTGFMNPKMWAKATQEVIDNGEAQDFLSQRVNSVINNLKGVTDAEAKLKTLRKEGGSEYEQMLRSALQTYIIGENKKKAASEEAAAAAREAAAEEAKFIAGNINYQERLITQLKERINLETDEGKRAAMSQDLANLERQLEVMKMTTAERRDYNALLERGKTPLPSVTNNITGKVTTKQKDPILAYRDRYATDSLPALEAELERYKNLYNRIDATQEQKEFFKTQIDGLEEGIGKLKDGMTDFNKEFSEEVMRSANIASNFGQAVAQSMSESMKIIFDAISSGEEIDASAMTKAILMPFADMAVQIGEVMVATGAAALAAKAIGKVGGPGAAIAAGAVLMALGAAAQSQIGRIGSSFGAGSSEDPYSYTGGKAVSNVSVQPIQVYGVLKGQDIYLSSEKYKQNKSR